MYCLIFRVFREDMEVYTDMEQWAEIRRRFFNREASKREILRETGMHWTTLEKILSNSAPPGYQMTESREKPKLGDHMAWIRDVLKADKALPKKQRHTAVRIWTRLREERGFTGGYTVVREAVSEIKRTSREVFMPLRHAPGEAQVDYFFALVNMAGVLRKVAFFCMALPYSDMFFIKGFPSECTESFWDGHVEAFAFFGGVPCRITYDNSRIAIRMITGCHARELTDGFLELASHYLFEYHFCTVRRPNEKGVVENTGKYARSNFLVPVPQVADFDELNAVLAEKCWNDGSRRLRGQGAIKHELLKEEAFLPIPEGAFDACRKVATGANSLSLVRFDDNDYSVPVDWAHHELTVKGYIGRVEICTRVGKRIARHDRLWGKEAISYEPVHYLPLLERKPGALDHAAPLFGFELPGCFDTLRRKLESQKGHAGTKDYIRVLRLIERFSIQRVKTAIEKALPLPCPSPEIVKLYCLPEESPDVSTFCLEGREHLRGVMVERPDLKGYGALLEQEGVA
jgi:transposase